MGDGTQLGHASSLHAGQTVPDGERRHGTRGSGPDDNFLTVLPAGCGTLRRVSYAVLQLLIWLQGTCRRGSAVSASCWRRSRGAERADG